MRSLLIGHFFLHHEDLFFPGFFCFFFFGWLVLIPLWGENNEQIMWESVPTRPFWPNLSNKEA
jgi:hypothetical protein